MQFIHSKDPETGSKALSERLVAELSNGRKVLWLICGGSNVPTAVEVMNSVRSQVPDDQIVQLTVMQTDERFGPRGHKDSNWKQLLDLGFNIQGIRTFPILTDLSREEIVTEYSMNVEREFAAADIIIGQFGIGPDGHVAGMLPHSPAVQDVRPTSLYDAEPFTRITLNPVSLKRVSVAYVFAFGGSKKEAVDNLKNADLSLDDEPAQILKQLPEAYFYSDQVK